ncbi:hypothetical protein [Chryseobacterium indologenes]|uniref:hypothetical protein n=1 Tax=Chryseobacterium indologenes TaxID=253 RepID=UPI0010244BBD|nr:hypothetical protein [Chryseobacterium indologenes]TLX27270.1 hypothetical protein FE904_02455 [Chryseobacterium indologenes]VFA43260.1 Uncharacterised protein [Chryseobacterium indologenes]
MTSKKYYLLLVLYANIIFSQVGIGTANPRGALDINRETTNTMGLVLPTNSSPDNMVNPMGGGIAIGTIMYDSTLSCVRVYKSSGWSNCLCDQCGTAGFTLDCSSGALTGDFRANTNSTGTKVINYTNATGQSYNALSIPSTGVTGLTATAPAGTLANGNGSITLTINGTPSSSGSASFMISIAGQSCTFTITVQAALRTVRILSFIPDTWNANLSNGSYSNIARLKLNNPANFGPNGTVKVTNFSYNTINVSTATAEEIGTAIDNADIIWIGYVATGYLPPNSDKRQMITQKINDKKKFFFIGNDNYNGTYFPAKTTFAGNTYDYYGFGTTQISVMGGGPANGIFGTIPTGQTIQQTRAVGKLTEYAGSAFLSNPDGSVNAVAGDNYVTVGDTNWYTAYESTDGFYNGTSSCTENNSSILFCNIFEKAVQYVLSN